MGKHTETETVGQGDHEMLQVLIDTMPLGVDIVDQDCNILFMNKAMEKIAGKDIIGQKCWTNYRDDKTQCIDCPLKTEIAIGETNTYYTSGVFGGRSFQIFHTGMIYEGKKAVLEIFNDLTEREKASEEIKMLQKAITQSPVSVVITDLNGNIEYVNPKFVEATGYTAEDVHGKNPRVLKSGEKSPEEYRALWGAITAGNEWRGEFHNKRKNGELYWEYASISPMKSADGKITHFVAVKEDITERKRLEAELNKYLKNLEGEVKQRTSELIQSEKMSSIGMLVAGVAHEVNNPLSYIKSNTEFMIEDIADIKKELGEAAASSEKFAGFEKMLKTNHDGVERIAVITKALKRFAKPELGGKAPSDINQGIRDTLVIIHNQLKYKTAVHENYGELPNVACAMGQINQVFMNLLINAAQAMEKGDIWIRTYRDDVNVYIEIKDNGKGIPKDKMQRLFTPFFTTKKEGTGLGLSISYGIIKEHKGSMTVESEEGEGTKFTVRIPIAGGA